ncbi:MAG TPA: hypothetical protein VH682_29615 [Gemmataceae bacterium]|jgi:hypothetical protein
MNDRHYGNLVPSDIPAALTLWGSYAHEMAVLAELSRRRARAKQLTAKALARGEQVLLRLHDARARLEDLQLRADELAKRFRPVTK